MSLPTRIYEQASKAQAALADANVLITQMEQLYAQAAVAVNNNFQEVQKEQKLRLEQEREIAALKDALREVAPNHNLLKKKAAVSRDANAETQEKLVEMQAKLEALAKNLPGLGVDKKLDDSLDDGPIKKAAATAASEPVEKPKK